MYYFELSYLLQDFVGMQSISTKYSFYRLVYTLLQLQEELRLFSRSFFHFILSMSTFPFFASFSDQMGNKGAFITLDNTLKPKFTTFAAVVSQSH